jgi:hypothetical protein
MDKLWYPVAVSAMVVGCAGDVDSGNPAATGGYPAVFYGVSIFTGGAPGIDAGRPTETGGVIAMSYGPLLVTGGASTGGSASTGGATSTVDVRACRTDSDCTQCVYNTAPGKSSECPNTLGCCGGQVMNKETCNWNQGAWQANCSGQGYTIPDCLCLSPCAGASCILSCKNGECGFW